MAFRVEPPEPPLPGELIVNAFKRTRSYVGLLGLWLAVFLFSAIFLSHGLANLIGLAGIVYFIGKPLRAVAKRLSRPTAAAHLTDPDPELTEADDELVDTSKAVLLGRAYDPETGLASHPLLLELALRNRHVYLIGKTRTGKTTLLQNILRQDLARGAGVGFIDPHGDAALELLGHVPPERIGDVMYFDPSSPTCPALNPFRFPYPPAKLAEDLISVFKMFFGDSWGYRLEHLLRYGVLTLVTSSEPRTLRDLRSLFLDPKARERLTRDITNESLAEFWAHEFPTIPDSAVSPILNKLSAFLAPTSPLERLFSRRENDLDFSAILNEGKILIVNLAKGVIGDEPARLIGGLIATGIQQAALARALLPPSERRDFYFFVDEFQNFTVASFESILAESAKYRLNLTLANQTLGQIPGALQRAIFGNVATLVSFQISADDAPDLRKEMHRARMLVRAPHSSAYEPLADFIAYQKRLYRAALADKNLGMSQGERAKLRHMQATADAKTSFTETLRTGGTPSAHYLRERREAMSRTLELLEEGGLTPPVLRDLFPDYEFRERVFPDLDDFVNLKPHHAFCRMERAENVFAFSTLPMPPANAETRRAILERAKARESERTKESNAPEPEPEPQRKRGRRVETMDDFLE